MSEIDIRNVISYLMKIEDDGIETIDEPNQLIGFIELIDEDDSMAVYKAIKKEIIPEFAVDYTDISNMYVVGLKDGVVDEGITFMLARHVGTFVLGDVPIMKLVIAKPMGNNTNTIKPRVALFKSESDAQRALEAYVASNDSKKDMLQVYSLSNLPQNVNIGFDTNCPLYKVVPSKFDLYSISNRNTINNMPEFYLNINWAFDVNYN